jgi:hypothetical protein
MRLTSALTDLPVHGWRALIFGTQAYGQYRPRSGISFGLRSEPGFGLRSGRCYAVDVLDCLPLNCTARTDTNLSPSEKKFYPERTPI